MRFLLLLIDGISAGTTRYTLASRLRMVSDLFLEYTVLIKARITMMVILVAWSGAYLATSDERHAASWSLLCALIGIGAVAAGASSANEILEYKTDSKMVRTAGRPLVTGTIRLTSAIAITLLLIASGTMLLAFTVNPLTSWLTLLSAVVYIGIYTPLKSLTPWCTAIGAIPGAMPILLGWTSMLGRIDWQAGLLFSILFLWQFPHFHAISLLYVDDYRRGGIRMLAVVDAEGVSTRERILFHSLALFFVGLLPFLTGMSGNLYGITEAILGLVLISLTVRLRFKRADPSQVAYRKQARHILWATLIYLPLLLLALGIDHAISPGRHAAVMHHSIWGHRVMPE
jgi:protoheme IX farnesyltransferase